MIDDVRMQAASAENLTPRGFERIVGQSEVVRRLRAFAGLYGKTSPLGHVLLVGREGMGKRAIAAAFAEEFGLKIRIVERSAGLRVGDLNAIVNDLERGDLLFLDVGALPSTAVESLATALRDFELSITVGKGLGAKSMRLAIRPFTCIGAVARESDCPAELSNSFALVLRLDQYSGEELQHLVEVQAQRQGLSIDASAAALIAQGSNGSPQYAQTLIERIAQTGHKGITGKEAAHIMAVFGLGSAPSVGHQAPTDLSALSGTEFETFVTAVLHRMGFRAETTKASGDGGIDIEASLDRQVVGGRYLFQCKRFAPDNLVGSATIREFYGALIADQRAAKGVLITTSGFTAQAREFAKDLPLELIDGDGLRRLMADNAVGKKLD